MASSAVEMHRRTSTSGHWHGPLTTNWMNIATGSCCLAAFFVTFTARFVSDGCKTDFAGVSNGSETRHKVSVGGKERNAFNGSIAGDQLIRKLDFSLIDRLSGWSTSPDLLKRSRLVCLPSLLCTHYSESFSGRPSSMLRTRETSSSCYSVSLRP